MPISNYDHGAISSITNKADIFPYAHDFHDFSNILTGDGWAFCKVSHISSGLWSFECATVPLGPSGLYGHSLLDGQIQCTANSCDRDGNRSESSSPCKEHLWGCPHYLTVCTISQPKYSALRCSLLRRRRQYLFASVWCLLVHSFVHGRRLLQASYFNRRAKLHCPGPDMCVAVAVPTGNNGTARPTSWVKAGSPPNLQYFFASAFMWPRWKMIECHEWSDYSWCGRL